MFVDAREVGTILLPDCKLEMVPDKIPLFTSLVKLDLSFNIIKVESIISLLTANRSLEYLKFGFFSFSVSSFD